MRSDGATVVRGGYGMYYGHGRILGNLNEFRNDQRFNVNISNPSYPDLYDGRDPLTFVSTRPPTSRSWPTTTCSRFAW